ncbi:uncharacterized protein [Haliotis asinina]|uniref:uncharacterized protein n=1 Tax=Haliotis asinina TaxID=109174 RepID=UPI003531A123
MIVYLLLGCIPLLLGLLVSALCLSCRIRRKSPENVGTVDRPSVSDDTEHIVSNIVLPSPSNERNKSSTSSVCSLLVSTTDQITPCPASPSACRSHSATFSDGDFNDDQSPSNLDCPLYVESYPLCRPDPSTQFLMDSCEDSVVDASSSNFPDCDDNDSDDDPYDYPLYNLPASSKNSTTGPTHSSSLMPTLKAVDVIVHPEPEDWKKVRSATIHAECPTSTITPFGDADNVKEENVYEELGAVHADSDVYANGNVLSEVDHATKDDGAHGSKKKMTKPSRKASASQTLPTRGQDRMCPPPCTGAEYVNFKGRLRSWKPPADD